MANELLINSRRAAKLWRNSGAAFPLSDWDGGTKHAKLREELLKSIDKFSLKAHDALPSEAGLCDLYSVSRAVVRQTLEGMESDGLIFRIKGKGSFLSDHFLIDESRFTLKGLYTQVIKGENIEFSNKILKTIFYRPPRLVYKKLELDEKVDIYYLERLRLVDNKPWVRIESFIPLPLGDRVSKFDASKMPLHLIFRKLGVKITRANRSVDVIKATPFDIKLMKIEKDPVILRVESIHYNSSGTPVEYSRASYRADCSRIEFSVSGEIDL